MAALIEAKDLIRKALAARREKDIPNALLYSKLATEACPDKAKLAKEFQVCLNKRTREQPFLGVWAADLLSTSFDLPNQDIFTRASSEDRDKAARLRESYDAERAVTVPAQNPGEGLIEAKALVAASEAHADAEVILMDLKRRAVAALENPGEIAARELWYITTVQIIACLK